LAGFYEENKLFIDAITAYEQAIKLAPDVPTYQEAYEEFLLRNKLKNQK
jgi:cytochrome c-type biogenesis protein CcmH/NrfG